MTTKYEQAREALQGLIARGHYAPGDRLPSVRELMKTHGVSYSTIMRALGELRNAGLIEKRWGKGNFVAQPSVATSRHIAVIFEDIFETTEPPYVDILRGIHEGISRAGWQMQLFPLPGESVLSSGDQHTLIALARERWVDAVFALSPHPPQTISALSGLGIPVVTLLNRYPRTGTSCVSYSPDQTACLITRYLIDELGHKRLHLILGPRTDSRLLLRSSTELGDAVRKQMADRGLPMPAGSIRHCPYDWSAVRGTVEKWLAASERPTAVYVSHEQLASQVAHRARQMGLSVPGDLSVMGFVSESETPELTSIAVPLSLVGKTAVELARSLLSGHGPSVQLVETELMVRGSCDRPSV